MASDGTTESDIAGATASRYTLVNADRAKTVRVSVSFTDDRGHQEARTSGPTVVVLRRTWSADMTVGRGANGSGYSSNGGELSATSFELEGVTYTFREVQAWDWLYLTTDRPLPAGLTFEVNGEQFSIGDADITHYNYGSVYLWFDRGVYWQEGSQVDLALWEN